MFGVGVIGTLGLDRLGGAHFGGGGTWLPDELFQSGEEGVWFDPSDLSTMFQDSAGTTPVTADGQPVGKILDKSGRGNHATQATAASRPLYKTDGTYHWLQFDGIDDSLSTAAIDFTGTDKMSVFSGHKSLLGSGVRGMLMNIEGVSPNRIAVDLNASVVQSNFVSGGTASVAAQWNNPPQLQVLACISDMSAPLCSISGNGVLRHSVVTTQGTGVRPNAPIFIGQFSGGSLRFNGNLYSLIVRGALSTPQEITDTETWVNSKTGAY